MRLSEFGLFWLRRQNNEICLQNKSLLRYGTLQALSKHNDRNELSIQIVWYIWKNVTPYLLNKYVNRIYNVIAGINKKLQSHSTFVVYRLKW